MSEKKGQNKVSVRESENIATKNAIMVIPQPEFEEYQDEGSNAESMADNDNPSGDLVITEKVEKTKTKLHFNPAALVSGVGGAVLLVLIGVGVAMLSRVLPDLLVGVQSDEAQNAAAGASGMLSEITGINSMISNWSQHICMIIGAIFCLIGVFRLATSLMRGSYDGESLFWTEEIKSEPKETTKPFKVKMPNELGQNLLEEHSGQ